ncbi:hypothetical protein [Alkaliphilus transvaalensis]|uniref:hypothetical protein n=1 Tax=Alkaliphilus transvaalensis TaxID=114628 RepID=UPI00047C0772|nr:hypothetical protein [Alkaliphilus transvaalensis]
MVILIGGIGCTGKTLMAQKLLEKYKMPYLSIDHLKMGLYRADENCGFTPLDSNELIGEKLWPIIRGIIMTNIENKQNIIIEGCYIMPHFIKDFNKFYSEKIISVFLGFSEKYIEKSFQSNIAKFRNAIENRTYPEDRSLLQYIKEHDELRKKCMETCVDYFEIKNNYEVEIVKVYDYIDDRVKSINYT